MPAPAMPATMRGDGRGTKVQPKKAVGRYFPGKGDDRSEHSESEEEEEDEDGLEVREEQKQLNGNDESIPSESKKATIHLKDVNLERHYEQERILEAQRIELEALNQNDDSASAYETDNSQDESSSEEEEEEEELPRRVLLKPTFISKSQRTTVSNADSTVAKSKADESPPLGSLDDAQKRRLEARQLLEQETRMRAQQALDAHHEDGSEVQDTDDPSTEEADRVAWKLRELLRIKRDRDALEAREKEREEIEQRKNNVPQEERLLQDIQRATKEREEKIAARRAEREELGGPGGDNNGTRSSRYHHRGGFYQDDPVVARQLSGKIEDTQANHGVKGANASRWTSLVQQDTTGRDSIWSDARDPGVKRTVEKMGGMKDQFNPQKKKRM